MVTSDAKVRKWPFTVMPASTSARRRFAIAGACVLIALYAALLWEHARTRKPWNDEAMFAHPAWNFVTTGSMGSPVFEEKGSAFPNVNRYTYYMFPLYLFTVAAWYQAVGFGLMELRALSMLWHAVLLFAFYRVIRSLLKDRRLALFAAALAALDYHVMLAASFGRYEPMVAALGFGGYACYLGLRERRFELALLLANACIAASGMTHPNGLLYFTGLVFLVWRYDRRRLAWKHLAIAAVPYIAGAAAWGLYALQSPESFLAQTRANSYSRFGILSPWRSVRGEIFERYLTAYGWGRHSAGHTGPIGLKILVLAAYAAAVGFCAGMRAVRTRPGCRTLLALTAVHCAYLTFFEGIKFNYYLVHILPLYAALLAVMAAFVWERGAAAKAVVSVCLAGLIGLQIGGILLKIRLNTYGNAYVPALAYLKQHASEKDLIMASCEMGFGYGFRPNLLDDIRFGYYSGKRPSFLVFDESYQDLLDIYSWKYPEIHRTITGRLRDEYELVYDRSLYKIYRRRR